MNTHPLLSFLAVFLIGTSLHNCASHSSASAETTSPMTSASKQDSIHFLPSSLSDFALAHPAILIADQMGNLLFIPDLARPNTAIYTESEQDMPQLVSCENTLMSLGRWDSHVKAWDGQQKPPIWTHELGKGFSKCIASDGKRAAFSFSATDPHGRSSKDQTALLPSVVMQVDPAGNIQQINWPNEQQGQVDQLAMNQTQVLIHLTAQVNQLELFTLSSGQTQIILFQTPLQALCATPDGRFLVAAEDGIWEIRPDQSSPQQLFSFPRDFPDVLQLVCTQKQEIFAMTSEGVFFFYAATPQQIGKTEQAVSIAVHEDELFVLWNGGEIEIWDAHSQSRKNSIPLLDSSKN